MLFKKKTAKKYQKKNNKKISNNKVSKLATYTIKRSLYKSKLLFYKVYSTNFSENIINKLLLKRDKKWIQINNEDNSKIKNNKIMDLCFLDGYYYTCKDIKTCLVSFNFNPKCSIYDSTVSCSLGVSIIDFLFKKKLYKINSKVDFYKIIGDSIYVPKTYLITTANLNKIINEINDNELYKSSKWIIKASDSYERKGLLRINELNTDKISKHIKEFKEFKYWQIQEFIEPLLKDEFFLRVDIVVIFENNKFEVYYSTKNEYAGIKQKDNNIYHFIMKDYIVESYKDKLNSTFNILDKNLYTGENGFANDILDQEFGSGFYEKNIVPQINLFLKQYAKSFFTAIKLKPNKTIFHLFGMDVMIDKYFKIKILEINIYPTHFVSGYLNYYSPEYISNIFSGNKMQKLNDFLEYESNLLDEIFSLTLDKYYLTNYKCKSNLLVKV